MRWRKKWNRVVKRFALFPITIGGETRWLETVYIAQSYRSYDLYPWYNDDFITKETYIRRRKQEIAEQEALNAN